MFKTLRKYYVAVQVANAAVEMRNAIAANGWLNPTAAEYAFTLYSAVGQMRLTVDEREKVVETLAEMRDDIVKAARRKIKP